jgi:hypothetical protein
LDGKYKMTSFFEVKLLKCTFETLEGYFIPIETLGVILQMAASLRGHFIFFKKEKTTTV